VAEHAAKFPLIEQLEDPDGAAHRSVPRVTAGGEGVGCLGGAEVQAWHRLARVGGQLADDSVHHRLLGLGHRPRVHGTQRQLVGVEVGVGVHPDHEYQRDEYAAAPEEPPDQHHQRGQSAEQQRGLQTIDVVVHGPSASRGVRSHSVQRAARW
jgi:hypothetical protein